MLPQGALHPSVKTSPAQYVEARALQVSAAATVHDWFELLF